uniref:Uncharacterized protein n=1 Tax=Nelumbo nucifera TaxID=4432 RepID=A0A822Z7R1_NELNU|nr:TPA_asm: hypothetical protein HUJ06_014044 [Nelumbo nucifera]
MNENGNTRVLAISRSSCSSSLTDSTLKLTKG